MVFLLGVNFSDRLLVSKALTSLYGISANAAAMTARAPARPPLKSIQAAVAGAASTASESNKSNSPSSSSSSSTASARAYTTKSTLPLEIPRPTDRPIGVSAVTSTSSSKSAGIGATSITQEPVLSTKRFSLLARLLAQHHIHATARLGDLTLDELNALTASLSTLTIENELRRSVRQNILRLRDMGSYRGRRHVLNLPVRGQRTRTQITNARKHNRVQWRD